MGRFRASGRHGTRKANPRNLAPRGDSRKEKGPGDYPGPLDWWRWRESNPRPKALHPRLYMLSPPFVLGLRKHGVRSTPQDTPARSCFRLAGRRRKPFRDDDPTSTSTDTSGFGAYALSGESVDVVVGVCGFAAGLTRKAAPSACARQFRNPRRSQDTPGSAVVVERLTRPVWVRAGGAARGRRRCPACGRACVQASLLRWRRARCFSRCQSLSRALSRLSCSCLPLASASSSLTLLDFQYIAVGTSV